MNLGPIFGLSVDSRSCFRVRVRGSLIEAVKAGREEGKTYEGYYEGTRRSFEERLKGFYGQGALLAVIALLSILGVRHDLTSLCWDTLFTFFGAVWYVTRVDFSVIESDEGFEWGVLELVFYALNATILPRSLLGILLSTG